ncbi:hypothetical protein U1Q18_025635, partial [Sarracenia purpurea var. burkii]
ERIGLFGEPRRWFPISDSRDLGILAGDTDSEEIEARWCRRGPSVAGGRIKEHKGGDEQRRRNRTLDLLDSSEIWRHRSKIAVTGNWSKTVEASCGFLLIGGRSDDRHNPDVGLELAVFGRSRCLGKLQKAKSDASTRRRRIE